MPKFFLSKFSPGLVKECQYRASLLSGSFQGSRLLTISTLVECIGSRDEVHVYNSSVTLPILVLVARFLKIPLIFYCHEPAKEQRFKHYNFIALCKTYIVELLNSLCILLATKTYVMSPYGYELISRGLFFSFVKNKVYQTRILMPVAPRLVDKSEVDTVLLFGQLNNTKTPYWVTDFVNHSKFLQDGGRLRILTASSMHQFLEELQVSFPGRLEVIRHEKLSDITIMENIQASVATIHLHHCVCQSGAMVESLRNGVPPVTLSDPGFKQFYGERHMVMIDKYDVQSLDAAINKIVENVDEYQAGAFRYYRENFKILGDH